MKPSRNEKILLRQGTLWGVYTGFTMSFLVAFALALGAPNTVIGILGALPWIASMLAQIPSAQILEYASRKNVYLIATGLSRTMWLLIILIPYFFTHNPYLYLVIFVFLLKFTNFSADPAWLSLFADIVPARRRGHFVADRSILVGIATMIASFVAGVWLDLFPKGDFTGFTTIFALGVFFGYLTTGTFIRIKEPLYQDHRHHPVKDFFTLRGDFLKFVMFVLYFKFAFMLASPFFAVYLLKHLEVSYTFFIIVVSISTIAKILSQNHYGKIIDSLGEKYVLLFTVTGTAIVPLIYLFINQSNIWLAIPAHIIGGFMVAGVDLCLFNMLLDCTDQQQRALQVAEYSMLTALPMIIAPILGGLLADHAAFVFTGIFFVFALSFLLRLASGLFVLRLKEPRPVKPTSAFYVFKRLIGLRPMEGIGHIIQVVRKNL